jgi:RNA polymerase sigma-70 factor (ECF subfamily)
MASFLLNPAIDALPAMMKLAQRARQSASPWSTPLTPSTGAWCSSVQDEPASPETQSERWQRLMVAAQNAEPRAYADLLRDVTPFIRVIARRYHADAGIAEDVVQETLISIHRMRHTYERGRPVEPWIATIAKARAIDMLRSKVRRTRFEAPDNADHAATVADRAPSAETTLVSQASVAEALASLSPIQRETVRLLKIEELSLREASTASGMSIQALKSSLHRAMLSLRDMLKDERNV